MKNGQMLYTYPVAMYYICKSYMTSYVFTIVREKATAVPHNSKTFYHKCRHGTWSWIVNGKLIIQLYSGMKLLGKETNHASVHDKQTKAVIVVSNF